MFKVNSIIRRMCVVWVEIPHKCLNKYQQIERQLQSKTHIIKNIENILQKQTST